MLEAGSRHGEFDGILGGVAGKQGVNEARAEGVAAAHAVHDMHMVALGEAVVLAVVQHCGPTVVKCGVGFTQSDRNLLEAELISQLLSNRLVALVVDGAAVDIGSLSLDAEYILSMPQLRLL